MKAHLNRILGVCSGFIIFYVLFKKVCLSHGQFNLLSDKIKMTRQRPRVQRLLEAITCVLATKRQRRLYGMLLCLTLERKADLPIGFALTLIISSGTSNLNQRYRRQHGSSPGRKFWRRWCFYADVQKAYYYAELDGDGGGWTEHSTCTNTPVKPYQLRCSRYVERLDLIVLRMFLY